MAILTRREMFILTHAIETYHGQLSEFETFKRIENVKWQILPGKVRPSTEELCVLVDKLLSLSRSNAETGEFDASIPQPSGISSETQSSDGTDPAGSEV